jgi:quercetin dioxygenase-like cupin family protein
VLVVTSGSGMVANEHEQREINVGDVVHIKAGERHWHGAKADTTMGISRSQPLAVKLATDSPALARTGV